MTYWQKEWNLYICRFVVLTKTIDHTDKGSFIVEESHFIQVDMFKSDNPETAYSHALSLMPGIDDGYRNDEGREVQLVCLGINDLDLLQINLQSLDANIKEYGSETLDVISENEMQKKPKDLIRKKEELTLFDK